jgi:hypothetical protein
MVDKTSPQSKEPENLSAESVHDLDYWLTGILKKAPRRAGIKEGRRGGQETQTQADLTTPRTEAAKSLHLPRS